MNGAESLLRTLVNGGVNVCFANPGTSEMQFVAAADRVPNMRCVLGLYEGVVTGAADGYARMANNPAATLLHLGPGLANGLANLHNAMRARVSIINIIGDQATWHRKNDPPLYSDIAAYARPVSGWVRDVSTAQEIPEAAYSAIAAALGPPGQIATLIVPADCAWSDADEPITDPVLVPDFERASEDAVQAAAAALKTGEPAVLLLSGYALREKGLELSGKVAAATGARLLCDTFNTRLQRGAGRVPVERLPYFPERVGEMLAGVRHMIIVGSRPPVGFFAYPGQSGELTPPGCAVHVLARPDQHIIDALKRLVSMVGAEKADPARQPAQRPTLIQGPLNGDTIALSLAALMPEQAIVADESISDGFSLLKRTAGAPPHDWLFITGGAIGQGMPLATGAAIASPDRKVINLQADGSAMYTLQALWTQARESLDVTTIIYANRRYRILEIEHERVGAGAPGPKAREMFSLDRPNLDWVRLAEGMGVPARRVHSAEAFHRQLAAYLREPGPNLIEAWID
ncbi:MAG: acetolactate synthase large subunit [Gammaproteobacteria bacterium]|nr:acetolactate synthase large subunit [Gammaproteobacteria bacterium]